MDEVKLQYIEDTVLHLIAEYEWRPTGDGTPSAAATQVRGRDARARYARPKANPSAGRQKNVSTIPRHRRRDGSSAATNAAICGLRRSVAAVVDGEDGNHWMRVSIGCRLVLIIELVVRAGHACNLVVIRS
jgi:hypothetical protein